MRKAVVRTAVQLGLCVCMCPSPPSPPPPHQPVFNFAQTKAEKASEAAKTSHNARLDAEKRAAEAVVAVDKIKRRLQHAEASAEV